MTRAPQAGDVLCERYTLEAPLGSGGSCTVWRALDQQGPRVVAIKLLKPVRSASALSKEHSLLALESALLRKANHPALPVLIDTIGLEPTPGQDTSALCGLVIELFDGPTLSQWVKEQGPQPEDRVRQWLFETGDVLTLLHGLQPPIIVRDLQPSNLIVKATGHLGLIDLGISKVLDAATGGGTVAAARHRVTHGFGAPEMYVGHCDVRSDIYSLGATFYHALTGAIPPSGMERLSSMARLSTVRSLRPDVSGALGTCLEQMLAVDRSRRPASVTEALHPLLH